jgi:hypothetical protein
MRNCSSTSEASANPIQALCAKAVTPPSNTFCGLVVSEELKEVVLSIDNPSVANNHIHVRDQKLFTFVQFDRLSAAIKLQPDTEFHIFKYVRSSVSHFG